MKELIYNILQIYIQLLAPKEEQRYKKLSTFTRFNVQCIDVKCIIDFYGILHPKSLQKNNFNVLHKKSLNNLFRLPILLVK